MESPVHDGSAVLLHDDLLSGDSLLRDREPSEAFDVVDSLVRLFTALEAVCLYDKVLVARAFEFESSNAFNIIAPLRTISNAAQEMRINGSALWSTVAKEGILGGLTVFDQFDFDDYLRTAFANLPDELKPMHEKARKTKGQMSEVYAKLLSCEIVGASYVPDHGEVESLSELRELVASKRIDRALPSIYATLSQQLGEDIGRLASMGRPVQLFVPPIPALILDRVSKRSDIPEATMELRRDLEHVRKAIHEYEATIKSDSVPLKEALGALRRLEEISNDLSRQYTDRGIVSVTEWRDVLDISPEGWDPNDLQDAKLSKFLLGTPIKKLVTFLRRRRVIYLYRLRNRFLKIVSYGDLLHRVLGIDLTDADASRISKLLNNNDAAIDKLDSVKERDQ